MKAAFIVYREVLDDRVTGILNEAGIDFYTEWEGVKGKGHETEAHLGTRAYPGYNNVRMIAFQNENQLEKLIFLLEETNKTIQNKDDYIRLFQIPLERIL
jgi:hypothetical protein